jgi:hypothetical protein
MLQFEIRVFYSNFTGVAGVNVQILKIYCSKDDEQYIFKVTNL